MSNVRILKCTPWKANRRPWICCGIAHPNQPPLLSKHQMPGSVGAIWELLSGHFLKWGYPQITQIFTGCSLINHWVPPWPWANPHHFELLCSGSVDPAQKYPCRADPETRAQCVSTVSSWAGKKRQSLKDAKFSSIIIHTINGRNPNHQLIDGLSHFLVVSTILFGGARFRNHSAALGGPNAEPPFPSLQRQFPAARDGKDGLLKNSFAAITWGPNIYATSLSLRRRLDDD